jgi:hypothetical protein
VYNPAIPSSRRITVMIMRGTAFRTLGGVLALALTTGAYALAQTNSAPVDPGVRVGPAGAGGPLNGLTADEKAFFQDGQARFADVEAVTGSANNGLGPRFNSNQCLSCHSRPDAGGSSPAHNPLIAVATLNGAKNTVPWFITANGPVREARPITSFAESSAAGGSRTIALQFPLSEGFPCLRPLRWPRRDPVLL